VLPPAGLLASKLDAIQKEILEIGHRMQPHYHPVIAPDVVQQKHVLVLWCPGGQSRPYKAPVSLAKGNREFAYYIRKGSATVRARHQEEVELISSDLLADSSTMDFAQVCRQMRIADGPAEAMHPLNVGLMFFNPAPQKFFPQTQIDVVQFPEGPGGDTFTEKTFAGPLDVILKDALTFLKNAVIEERVVKHGDRPEADRFFNVPYAALEEAVVNAVYHRSYEIREPIEVRVLPDEITVASYPGLDRSVNIKELQTGRFATRRYRNRRIGEFLKELSLTEGRGTGIPKMLKALRVNGSPKPVFESDNDRTFFLVRLPLHPEFIKEARGRKRLATGQVTGQVAVQILQFCEQPRKAGEIQSLVGVKHRQTFRENYLNALIGKGWLGRTIPDKPQSRLQSYQTTDEGKKWLQGATTEPRPHKSGVGKRTPKRTPNGLKKI
jgi:ATP-dependent DNA helicase RecG